MPHSTITLSTENASRLIKRLCKHFSHKVEVNFDETHGEVDFPFGECEMEATDKTLTFTLQAEDEEGLQRGQKVVSDHADQFARDEQLQWNWE